MILGDGSEVFSLPSDKFGTLKGILDQMCYIKQNRYLLTQQVITNCSRGQMLIAKSVLTGFNTHVSNLMRRRAELDDTWRMTRGTKFGF